MAYNTKLSSLAVDAEGDAFAALMERGFIDVMTAPQPEGGPEEPIKNQVVLVTLTFGSPAFQKAVDGILSAFPISPSIAMADGDPKWFRAYRADHKTAVFDGSAGKAKDNNMVLPAKTIIAGVTVGCSSFTHRLPKSTPGI